MNFLQRKNKKPTWKIGSETAFSLLLLLTWIQKTVVGYALVFIRRVPYIGVPIAEVYPFLVVALIVLALPWMLKRIRAVELLLYLLAVAVVLLSTVLYPQNAEHIQEELVNILAAVLPMIFLGVCYDYERHKNMLFWASLLGTVTMFSYQVYQLAIGRELLEDSMYSAYLVLPSVMYLIYYAADKKKTLCWVIATLAALTMFTYGTRGPILCMTILLSVYLLISVWRIHSMWKRLLCSLGIVAVVAFVLSGEATLNLATWLSEIFDKIGFSTRLFDFYIEGEILDTTGRERIIPRAMSLIWQSPVWGYGFMGDRVYFSAYPHNLFVELWMHYGLLFGTIAGVAAVGLPITALYRQRGSRDQFLLLLMFVCLTLVKLMLSSSYIQEPYLFFMFGVCLAARRNTEHLSDRKLNRARRV